MGSELTQKLILTESQLEENYRQRTLAIIYSTCIKWNVNPRIPVAWVPIARRIWMAMEEGGVIKEGMTYQHFARALAEKVWADHMGIYIEKIRRSGTPRTIDHGRKALPSKTR